MEPEQATFCLTPEIESTIKAQLEKHFPATSGVTFEIDGQDFNVNLEDVSYTLANFINASELSDDDVFYIAVSIEIHKNHLDSIGDLESAGFTVELRTFDDPEFAFVFENPLLSVIHKPSLTSTNNSHNMTI